MGSRRLGLLDGVRSAVWTGFCIMCNKMNGIRAYADLSTVSRLHLVGKVLWNRMTLDHSQLSKRERRHHATFRYDTIK